MEKCNEDYLTRNAPGELPIGGTRVQQSWRNNTRTNGGLWGKFSKCGFPFRLRCLPFRSYFVHTVLPANNVGNDHKRVTPSYVTGAAKEE